MEGVEFWPIGALEKISRNSYNGLISLIFSRGNLLHLKGYMKTGSHGREQRELVFQVIRNFEHVVENLRYRSIRL